MREDNKFIENKMRRKRVKIKDIVSNKNQIIFLYTIFYNAIG